MKSIIKKLLRESIYYHGAALPKDNPTISNFITKTGYRSNPMLQMQREVNSPWTFFTDSEDLARKFGGAKVEGLYHDKGDFRYKAVVLKYDIDDTKLNILDLTIEGGAAVNGYEFALLKIGIDLSELYGVGGYDIDMMWELLDDNDTTNIIINAGYNAVKLIENGTGYNGTSLAILTKIVNNVIKQL